MPTTDQRPPAPTGTPEPRRRPGALELGLSQAAFLVQGGWERLRPWRGWRWIGRAAAVLFAVALPVALVSANVRILFTAKPIYTFAVEQYNVPAATGIPREEIDRSMDEIRDYFSNDQQLLRITVTDDQGHTNPLFTPREVIHMRDVKQLVRGIFTTQVVTLLFVAGYVALRIALERRAGLLGLARLTRLSMLGTLVVAAGFGVATLAGFDRLFQQFHVLSFSNDLWQLDPNQDHLVQMFPFDFWLVSTVILTGMTVVEVLALLSLSWWYWQRHADTEPAQGTG